MDTELNLKTIKKVLKHLKKYGGPKQPTIWVQYEGHVFKADSLPELRLQIGDYVAKQILKEKIGTIYPDEWKDAKIGEMPTWASIPMNFAEVLHRKIPPLPESIKWVVWRRKHGVHHRIDCQGWA